MYINNNSSNYNLNIYQYVLFVAASPPPHTYQKQDRHSGRPFDKSRQKFYPRHQQQMNQQQHSRPASSTSLLNTPPLSPKKGIFILSTLKLLSWKNI